MLDLRVLKLQQNWLRNKLLRPVILAEQAKLRIAAVEDALKQTPHFVPIKHTLPAGNQKAPYESPSDALQHDVILFGGITNAPEFACDYWYREESEPFVRVGEKSSAHLTLGGLVGQTAEGNGTEGLTYFSMPEILYEQERLNLRVFKTEPLNDPLTIYTVFFGQRMVADSDAKLTDTDRKNVLENINSRPFQLKRHLVVNVKFDAKGLCKTETPQADEPLLIKGFRTTLKNSLVNFGYEDQKGFAKVPLPIWALAAEQDNNRYQYYNLLKPIFLPRRDKLTFSLENTLNGVDLDEDGTIELSCTTV